MLLFVVAAAAVVAVVAEISNPYSYVAAVAVDNVAAADIVAVVVFHVAGAVVDDGEGNAHS